MSGRDVLNAVPELGNDPLALDRQVCFALAVASRSVIGVYRPLLEPLQLTHPQYLVMLALWERSPRSVKDISSSLRLDPATLSPLLKRLEAMELISRTRDRSDERLVIIGLTRAGRKLQERASSVTLDVCRASGLTLDETAAMVAELRLLDERLKTSTREARD